MKRVALVAGMLVVAGVVPAASQSVEAILRQRETLALTEEQVASLDAIRREIVSQRAAEMAEMSELRSQLEAGMIRRSEVIAAQEDRQAAAQGRAEERRTRIDAVLTEEQRLTVDQMATRADRQRARRQGFGPGGGGFGRGRLGPGGGRGGFGPGGGRGLRGGARLGPRGLGPR